MSGDKIDIEAVVGLLYATQTIVMSLVQSHPDRAALLDKIEANAAGIQAAVATTAMPVRAREAARAQLESMIAILWRRLDDAS